MDKEYRFYGSGNCDCTPLTEDITIKDPKDLYDALEHVWCADTCAPRLRDRWTEDNKTWGQCSITAFLVQDIFGGKVFGVPREGGTFHSAARRWRMFV